MALPETQDAYGFRLGEREIVRFQDVPVGKPKSGEVLLKVEASGLCASDLHILQAQSPLGPKEFIMGHEIAGQIVAVGENVDTSVYYVGGRYAMCITNSCGVCPNCRRGKDNGCTANGMGGSGYGINSDGGFRQYMVISNVRTLLAIPDGVSYEQAAVASDSVLTPFHAINKVRDLLSPTTKVMVVGLGGLGLNAVQILRHYGCHILAVDIKPELGSVAKSLGAHEFYTDPCDSPHAMESFEVCFDFAGMQESSDFCQSFVKSQGKIVVVGMGRSKLMLKNYDLARREITVVYNFGGTAYEQQECMEWIAQGKVKPQVSTASLHDIKHYLHKLHAGGIKGRIVFRHSKL